MCETWSQASIPLLLGLFPPKVEFCSFKVFVNNHEELGEWTRAHSHSEIYKADFDLSVTPIPTNGMQVMEIVLEYYNDYTVTIDLLCRKITQKGTAKDIVPLQTILDKGVSISEYVVRIYG